MESEKIRSLHRPLESDKIRSRQLQSEKITHRHLESEKITSLRRHLESSLVLETGKISFNGREANSTSRS